MIVSISIPANETLVGRGSGAKSNVAANDTGKSRYTSTTIKKQLTDFFKQLSSLEPKQNKTQSLA